MNVSIQTCMDTIDYFKGKVQGNLAMVNSSSGEIISCSTSHPPPPTVIDHRLLPRPDQALKCPRCTSTQTKFCYYNNYSLSQPRYFCKTCRRYWTKGGSLRNIPVGGGCRKNKRSGSSGGNKPAGVDPPPFLHQYNSFNLSPFTEHTPANVHLPSHLGSLPGCGGDGGGSSYRHMQSTKFHHMLPPAGYLLNGNQTTLVRPSPVDDSNTSSGTGWKAQLSMEWQESSHGDVGRVSSLGYCSSGTGNEYQGTNTFHI